MSGVIDSIERAQLRRVPVFQAGDRVRVHFQVVEGTRRRTQVFEGTVIKRQGTSARETFTVRKQSFGVGVERTFPVHSPKIERIEVAARGDVRRAKLYYLRERVGRRARVRERRWIPGQDDAFETGAMPPDDAARPGEEELADATDAEAAGAAGAVAPEADPADAVAPEADPADATEAELAQPSNAAAAQTAGGEPHEPDGEPRAGNESPDLGDELPPDSEAKGDEPAEEPAEKTET